MLNERLNDETIREEIRNRVAELTECELHEVTDSASFIDDIGLDSLLALELMVALDKEFGIDIPENEFREINNLSQAVEVVTRHAAQAA